LLAGFSPCRITMIRAPAGAVTAPPPVADLFDRPGFDGLGPQPSNAGKATTAAPTVNVRNAARLVRGER
jgi:hypothetical protein